MDELYLAEIPYEGGSIRFRYARKMSADGTRWIKHGLFQAFHPNGMLASEGSYRDGLEQGVWRDFHENGQLAAERSYQAGVKAGHWSFWTSDGTVEASAEN